MKTDELMQLGLSREQADSILAMNGRDIERTKSANQQERLELERIKTELSEREKELGGYRSMDFDGLKQELDEWKEKAEHAERTAKEQAEQYAIRRETEKLYQESGVKNAKLLDVLIDWENVKLENDTVSGLEEQINGLKQQYGYLFHSDSALPQFSAATGKMTETDGENAVREAMGI